METTNYTEPEQLVQREVDLLNELRTEPVASEDPALIPLIDQLSNSLKHVKYGFRYGEQQAGIDIGRRLLAPTTNVFIGASDSIAAYGGGNITAITIEEMNRRGKAWSFTPAQTNQRMAEIVRSD
jgi:hypothetical protein